jgi:actin-related protein
LLDEINALVIDVGTHTTRAGFAGEDTPKCAFPTVNKIFFHFIEKVMKEDLTSLKQTVGVTYSKGKENENTGTILFVNCTSL